MKQILQDTRNATVAGTGIATVTFGPQHPRHKYTVQRVSVQCSTNTLESTAQIYRGNVGRGSRISGTVSGSTGDTDPDLSEELWSGQFLTVQWTGADVGATATATFWGEIDTG